MPTQTTANSTEARMFADDTQFDMQQIIDLVACGRSDRDLERHVENLSALTENMVCQGRCRTDLVRMIQAYLGDRWSPLTMHLLSSGMPHYSELGRLICLVSSEREISPRSSPRSCACSNATA